MGLLAPRMERAMVRRGEKEEEWEWDVCVGAEMRAGDVSSWQHVRLSSSLSAPINPLSS